MSKNKIFAHKIAKHLPYDISIIERSLDELVNEGVLIVEGDSLVQKRMVNDFKISEIRANSAKHNGSFAPTKPLAKPLAKDPANPESEDDNEIEIKIIKEWGDDILSGKDFKFTEMVMIKNFTVTQDFIDWYNGLCATYAWKFKSQQHYRMGLIGKIQEYKNKQNGTGKNEYVGTVNKSKAERELQRANEADEQDRQRNS